MINKVYTVEEINAINAELAASIDMDDPLMRGLKNLHIADLFFGDTDLDWDDYIAAWFSRYDDVVEDYAEYAMSNNWVG